MHLRVPRIKIVALGQNRAGAEAQWKGPALELTLSLLKHESDETGTLLGADRALDLELISAFGERPPLLTGERRTVCPEAFLLDKGQIRVHGRTASIGIFR